MSSTIIKVNQIKSNNFSDLEDYLSSFRTKISLESPYFVSEFIAGKEYTGNVIAKDGKIYIFTSNPSSSTQIDYDNAAQKKEIFNWVHEFVWKKNLSGSLCFDFIENSDSVMVAIECNPRLHSSIVLMNTRRKEAADANELGKLLHGSTMSEVLQTIMKGRDAVWDLEDPLPFFLLPHLQIPSLLWENIVSGEDWTIINFCLGQLR